jgi:uncharacterized membrane protein
MKQALWLGALLLFASFAHAATVTGTAYDGLTLDVLKNVVVSVSTNPLQTKLSKEGTYSFDVTPGTYTLSAKYLEQGVVVMETSQSLKIEKEGAYTIDLILLPNVGDVNDIPLPDEEPPLTIWEQLVNGPLAWLLVLAIVLGGVAYTLINGKKNIRKHPEPLEELNEGGAKKHEIDPTKDIQFDQYAMEMIHHLARGGNRLTQKELRGMMNIGEAKVSLVVSEMEAYGVIKKIKKGRGNILILTDKGREEAAKKGKGPLPPQEEKPADSSN